MAESQQQTGTAPEMYLNASLEWWRMWSDFGSRVMRTGWPNLPLTPPAESLRQWRSSVLQALAESSDDYLRSPQFLEAMRFSLGQVIDWRRQFNETLGRFRHELQGVSRQDLDQLMDALNHVERRMSDNFERLTEQLQALEQRLGQAAPGPVAKPTRPRRTPPKGAPAPS